MTGVGDIIVRAALLGDFNSGKTSIFQMYLDGKTYHNPTIGIDFDSKTHVCEGQRITVQLWDTAGQERFRSITQMYLRNIHLFFVVVDVTCTESVKKLDFWIDFIKTHSNGPARIMVLASKTDLLPNNNEMYNILTDWFENQPDVARLYFVSVFYSSEHAHMKSISSIFHECLDLIYANMSKSSSENIHGIKDLRIFEENNGMTTPQQSPTNYTSQPMSKHVMTTFGFKNTTTTRCNLFSTREGSSCCAK